MPTENAGLQAIPYEDRARVREGRWEVKRSQRGPVLGTVGTEAAGQRLLRALGGEGIVRRVKLGRKPAQADGGGQ
jgi:hypothetical protein